MKLIFILSTYDYIDNEFKDNDFKNNYNLEANYFLEEDDDGE